VNAEDTKDARSPKTAAVVKGASSARGSAAEVDSAVRRALAILSVFRFSDPILGVSEIGRRLELPKTTVHRLLATLVAEGFVERTGQGKYRLSLKMFEIGQEAVQSHGLRQIGHGPLERLRNETGETAHLAVLSGTDVLYIDRLESAQMMKLLTKVGRRRSAHATSTGKCLLAFGTPADVDAAIAAGLPRMAPRTITTPTALRQSLQETRKNGYAVSINESAPDISSVAAPIFDRSGACVAAVSVAGSTLRMPAESLDRYVRLVVRAAADISKGLSNDPTW
jgi:IclR family transcriptional regulator, acetate operon repressor